MKSFPFIMLLALVLCPPSVVSAADEGWINLLEQVNPQEATVAGNWRKSGQTLTTNVAQGSRLTLPYQPKQEYDFRVEFTRTSGVHSIAIMFVMGSGQATFEIDAWGEHLAGLQMVNNQSIQQNATRKNNMMLENGRRYTALIQVRKNKVRALLDDTLIAELETDGSNLSMPNLWRMPDATSLGIGAYQAETVFHNIEVKPIEGGAMLASAAKPQNGDSTTGRRPPRVMTTTPKANATGKRVLIVIANQDFFYREYADPREALEQAGIEVEVAAGRKTVCRPHHNSGQQGSGEVMPDLAISDVDVSRYDAIMFSGGWGSSMYQYAFNGSYSNRTYNGERQIKETVNRMLAEFMEQDKIVGALCHGVSVLAWARVDGKSILQGRRAVGSPRQSPAGIYNGQRSQPLSRWNAEVNGARLTPIRSIGNPNTSADDVLVDGKIITGEDDNSARLFGETLARMLTTSK